MTEYAAVFKRVSTDMTRQDITNQDADTAKLVAAGGYTVARTFEVEGSAFHGEHDPSLREILADVKAGKYTVVITAMTSRIDRRGPEYVMRFMWDLRAAGGRIEAADNPMFGKGDFVGDMATMFAAEGDHQYSKKISENVTRSHANIRARGAWVGSIPFGYRTEGERGRKMLIPGADAELAREVFQRIADGRSASSVAAWLDGVCPQVIKKSGKKSPWRAKRIIDMVKNPVYKGQHATHTGYEALVGVELWDSANAVMATRSFTQRTHETGGRRATNGYSSAVYCTCRNPLYFHQSSKNGKPVGTAKLRCAKGRRAIGSETRCDAVAIPAAAAMEAVDALMLSDFTPEWVLVTEGGDAERQARIQAAKAEMAAATKAGDMDAVIRLAGDVKELEAMPATPVITRPKRTGRKVADVWEQGTLSDRRAFLDSHAPDLMVVVTVDAGNVVARYEGDAA